MKIKAGFVTGVVPVSLAAIAVAALALSPMAASAGGWFHGRGHGCGHGERAGDQHHAQMMMAPPTLEEIDAAVDLRPDQESQMAQALDEWQTTRAELRERMRDRKRDESGQRSPGEARGMKGMSPHFGFIEDSAEILDKGQLAKLLGYLSERRESREQGQREGRGKMEKRRAERRDAMIEKHLAGLEEHSARMSDFLTTVLDLDETQRQQVTAILSDAQMRTEALLKDVKDDGVNRKDAHSEARQIKEGTAELIRPLLRPDQLEVFEALGKLHGAHGPK